MQTYDGLRVLDYALSRSDVDPEHIQVLGKGNAGTIALYVAALDPRVARVAADNSVASYLDIVRAQEHQGVLDIIIPGVLKDFDLPDLVKAIGPGKIWVINPRSPEGSQAAVDHVAAEYGPKVRVLESGRGRSIIDVYSEWVQ